MRAEVAGERLLRLAIATDPARGGTGRPGIVYASTPQGGLRRNLTREEADAFWAWAVVEVLRHTGVRVEELLELTHRSLAAYTLPTTGEVIPLVQITPSNSRILQVTRYGSAGPRPEGMVMTVNFELDGQEFIALNGGPEFTFNEAISFQVNCESQEEVDEFWTKLSDGGEEGPCGWLKDKYGVSWQIVPTVLDELIRDSDPEKSQPAMKAMLGMRKIDIAELQRAADQA